MSGTVVRTALGIDVGGTHIRCGLVDARGMLHAVQRTSHPPQRTPDAFLQRVQELIACVTNMAPSALRPSAVALALPGPLDPKTSRLVRSVNLAHLEGAELRSGLEAGTGLPVKVVTDCAAATWGEYCAAPSPASSFVHLRIGTGVALGVVAGGKLMETEPGRRTHLEMLVVDRSADAPPCPCGLWGCLETIASGRALLAAWASAGGADGLKGMRAAFLANDGRATRGVMRAVESISRGLQQVARAHGLTHGVIGGGVIEAFPELGGAVLDACTDWGLAVLGDDAGVIGAGLLAMQIDSTKP